MHGTYLVHQLYETAAPLQHLAVPITFHDGLRPFRDPLLDWRSIVWRTFQFIIPFFGNQGHYRGAISVTCPNPVSSVKPTIQVHDLPSSILIANRIFHILSHLTAAPNLPAITQEIGKVDGSTRMESREVSREVFQVLLFLRQDWCDYLITSTAGTWTLLKGKGCIDRGVYLHGCRSKFRVVMSITFCPCDLGYGVPLDKRCEALLGITPVPWLPLAPCWKGFPDCANGCFTQHDQLSRRAMSCMLSLSAELLHSPSSASRFSEFLTRAFQVKATAAMTDGNSSSILEVAMSHSCYHLASCKLSQPERSNWAHLLDYYHQRTNAIKLAPVCNHCSGEEASSSIPACLSPQSRLNMANAMLESNAPGEGAYEKLMSQDKKRVVRFATWFFR